MCAEDCRAGSARADRLCCTSASRVRPPRADTGDHRACLYRGSVRGRAPDFDAAEFACLRIALIDRGSVPDAGEVGLPAGESRRWGGQIRSPVSLSRHVGRRVVQPLSKAGNRHAAAMMRKASTLRHPFRFCLLILSTPRMRSNVTDFGALRVGAVTGAARGRQILDRLSHDADCVFGGWSASRKSGSI